MDDIDRVGALGVAGAPPDGWGGMARVGTGAAASGGGGMPFGAMDWGGGV